MAIERTGDDPVMREHLGDIYLKLSNRQKARGEWLKSLKLDPENRKLREKFKKTGFGDPDLLLKDQKPGAKKTK